MLCLAVCYWDLLQLVPVKVLDKVQRRNIGVGGMLNGKGGAHDRQFLTLVNFLTTQAITLDKARCSSQYS